MPTLKRFGSMSIRMYADDHNPPHVHVVGADFQVLVRLSDSAILVGEVRPSRVAEAMKWIEAHREDLADAWASLNERD